MDSSRLVGLGRGFFACSVPRIQSSVPMSMDSESLRVMSGGGLRTITGGDLLFSAPVVGKGDCEA